VGGGVRYVVRLFLGALATLLFVLLFNFVLFRVMPGSPIDNMARGQRLSPDEKQALIADLGLDKPLPQQIPGYLWDTIRGNLGLSLTSGRPVTEVVGARVWPTVLLLVPATILSVGLGILLGIRAGWRRGTRADITATGVSLTFYSIPEGWLAMMLLILFGSILKIFPLGGYASPTPTSGPTHVADVLSHMFLPVLTITIAYMGEYMLIMRSSLVDVKDEDYIQTARSKGLNDGAVRRRHALPNALLPTVTLVFLSFGFIFGGAVLIEGIFGWPGLGQLTFQAIDQHDYPVIQAVFLISSAAVIFMNFAADLIYGYLDPRIRTG
jgi:peptide/nickel transport system permease protein